MASSTKNVKIGVCKVFFGGVDLGLTQGGVDVTVKTDTHKVMVDQFGKTPINEYIMGREVTVKCPLAESTLDNMVAIMPGAVLSTDGVKATGSFTVVTVPTAGETISVNGQTFTFQTTPVLPTDIAVETTVNAQATAIAEVISGQLNLGVAAVASSATVNLTYNWYGTAGNSIAISANAGTNVTASGATLTGGTQATYMQVTSPTGIGTDLLSTAKPLVLHPVSKEATDHSEDFTVLQAATSGSMSFAYQLEKERVFNCDFTGYPDSNGNLFKVGGYLNQ